MDISFSESMVKLNKGVHCELRNEYAFTGIDAKMHSPTFKIKLAAYYVEKKERVIRIQLAPMKECSRELEFEKALTPNDPSREAYGMLQAPEQKLLFRSIMFSTI
ncbi:unnamed protein product [Angiostrongylus costaricensis]|uniref:MSP domain-containing protein n=1 Tax=Angiostrongylus costaricensis TaxID=334426 RepID=A0A0R3PRP4_ANGCS|nr:unnamed protein product [Angiostrongylus costaricensis]